MASGQVTDGSKDSFAYFPHTGTLLLLRYDSTLPRAMGESMRVARRAPRPVCMCHFIYCIQESFNLCTASSS